MAQNPSSNDPSHLEESFQAAMQRQKNTVTGLSANDVAFFNETDRHPNPSSNDKAWRDEQFELARRRFGGR